MIQTAKWVAEIDVIDPDTNQPITLSVGKHENGGMFAIDSSFLEQVARTEDTTDEGKVMLPDPFSGFGVTNEQMDEVDVLIVEGDY